MTEQISSSVRSSAPTTDAAALENEGQVQGTGTGAQAAPEAVEQHEQIQRDVEEAQEQQGPGLAQLAAASRNLPEVPEQPLEAREQPEQANPELVRENQAMSRDANLAALESGIDEVLEQLMDPAALSADDKALIKAAVREEYEACQEQIAPEDFVKDHSSFIKTLKAVRRAERADFMTASEQVKLSALLRHADPNPKCADYAASAVATGKELPDFEINFANLWKESFNEELPEELQGKDDAQIAKAYAQKQSTRTVEVFEPEKSGHDSDLDLGDTAQALLTAINSALNNPNPKLYLSAEDIEDNIDVALEHKTITPEEADFLRDTLKEKVGAEEAREGRSAGTEQGTGETRAAGRSAAVHREDPAALQERKTKVLDRFVKTVRDGPQGEILDTGITAGDKASKRGRVYTYKGFVFCRLASDPDTVFKSKDKIKSKDDLSDAGNMLKATGLGEPLGDTGSCGIAAYKRPDSAKLYPESAGEEGYVYLIDLSKLPQGELAFDVDNILTRNNLSEDGADPTGGLVNLTSLPKEAVSGAIKLSLVHDLPAGNARTEDFANRLDEVWVP